MTAMREKLIYAALALMVAGLIALALRPEPVRVDTAIVTKGPLQATVDEEGETRAHDRFAVAAPVAGRLMRVELHDGDPIAVGEVVARIAPVPLSVQECAEQQARLSGADARRREGEEVLRHAQADYEQARRDSRRMQDLAQRGVVSTQSAEQTKNAEVTMRNELDAARQKAIAADADVQLAKAGLMASDSCDGKPDNLLEVRSPVQGRVLRIIEKSERVVGAGAPLLIVGDPGKMEVLVDVLSSEAVKVRAGMPVLLENWGGEHPLRATVRIVEPYGFTKVSALGIEEQRVNIVLDFVDPPDGLGDGFRVDARIIVWEGASVVKMPTSAVFRHGDGFAVFVVDNDRAHRRTVHTGHRGAFEMEILAGLSGGEQVVVHPPNELDDGMRIAMTPQ